MSNPAPATVRELIDRQSAIRPDAIYALGTDGGPTIHFGELADDCRAVAAWLRASGSKPGDVVSIVMPNGLQTLRILLGAMAGGWCVNPVNLLSKGEQMRHVIAHSDCRIVFVTAEREAMVRELLTTIDREITVVVTEANADAIPLPPGAPSSEPASDALALLMYTSGTTGLPKGVMLTQANLAANARAISDEHRLTPDDRVLAVLPLYHINAAHRNFKRSGL